MTPDLAAQSLLFLACVAAWVYRKPLMAFLDDVSDGNVERLERDEMAREAQAVLAVMMDRRWT